MTTFANDHLALRVADIEAATRFYVQAFDAEVLTNPFVIEGDLAEAMMDGVAGVRFRLRHLRFTQGMIELFEFIDRPRPAPSVAVVDAPILHAGFRVDDVDGTAARVVRAGGRVLVPVTQWGAYTLMFCADLDGNVLELADASIDELATATKRAFPEARL
jgi:catechol 2,3-dioxygenase-like lactoylglutathione lyase family enzyme